MAASTLALTYTELRRWVGREIGKTRTPADLDSIATTDVADAIKAGLRAAYWPVAVPGHPVLGTPHVWSFLAPTLAQLTLHEDYSTGTVAITTGTVTLTGGTWPSWAAAGELWVNDAWYTVASRTNNSVIVLDDSTVTGLSGETYRLNHREYDLPDDFGSLDAPFTYRQDQSRWRTLTKVNEAMIRAREDYPRVAGPPEYFAIVSAAPTSAQESKCRATFSPQPDGDYELWYRYNVVPPMLDGSSYVYAHGGAQFNETLLLSCLDKALQMLYGDDSKHASFLEALAGAVAHDRRATRPKTHGFGAFSDGYDRDPWRRDNRGQFTFDTSNL